LTPTIKSLLKQIALIFWGVNDISLVKKVEICAKYHDMLSQQDFLSLIKLPLAHKGQTYLKTAKVIARLTTPGQYVETITSDGLETSIVAKAGDYLVTNMTESQEAYLVPGSAFEQKYQFLDQIEGSDKAIFQSRGKVMAIRINESLLKTLRLTAPFEFMAPSGQPMSANMGDFLAVPIQPKLEVYRIAEKEFHETYEEQDADII
jgi:hypothetical protein